MNFLVPKELLNYKLNQPFREKVRLFFLLQPPAEVYDIRLYNTLSNLIIIHWHPLPIIPSYSLRITVIFSTQLPPVSLSDFNVCFDELHNTLAPSFPTFSTSNPYFCPRIHSHSSCNQFFYPYQSLETLLFGLISISVDFLPHFLKSASLFFSLHHSLSFLDPKAIILNK